MILADVNSLPILLLGRLLDGIATTLLFSIMDTWLIRAHRDAHLQNYLGRSFSCAAYGNAYLAMYAFQYGDKVAFSHWMVGFRHVIFTRGGFLVQLDRAFFAFIACGILAYRCWDDNTGEAINSRAFHGMKLQWHRGVTNAIISIICSSDLLTCGIITILSEGSVYVSHDQRSRCHMEFLSHMLISLHVFRCFF